VNTELRVIVSNIEKYRHLHRLVPYFIAEDPDVMLLQEVPFSIVPYLASRLHADARFVPMGIMSPPEGSEIMGLATLVRHDKNEDRRLSIRSYGEVCYRRVVHNEGLFPVLRKENNFACNSFVQHVEVVKQGASFVLGNTHFPWTPKGQPDPVQWECMPRLVQIAKVLRPILCGDFNAPRVQQDGTKGVMWDMLAAEFDDNIPMGEITTLDASLHRASIDGVALPLVVDGVFTPRMPKDYHIRELKVVPGLSDHKVISFVVRRVS